MDGSLVGTGYLSTRPCDSVFAWNVLSGVRTQVSGAATCGEGPTSTGSGVTEVAVAGQRLAWLVNEGGNSEQSERLYSAILPTRPSGATTPRCGPGRWTAATSAAPGSPGSSATAP